LKSTTSNSQSVSRTIAETFSGFSVSNPVKGQIMNFTKPTLFFAAICGCSLLLCANAPAAAGDLYETDLTSGTIYKFAPDGTKSVFASSLVQPYGVVFDKAGNLFVSSRTGGTITKITPAGSQTPFASGLNMPAGLAFDANGILYVADFGASQIVQITATGTKSTFASNVVNPVALAFDNAGNLFVTEQGNAQVVSKFGTGKTKTTFASNVDSPSGVLFDPAGNLYVSTYTALGGTTGKILKFAPDGSRATFASSLNAPYGMAFDAGGNIFVTERGTNSILKFNRFGGGRVTFASSLSLPEFLAFEPALSQPINISTRLNVQTDENVLIAGFIATGNAPKKLVIRALGPSLGNFGIPTPLLDPTLELHAANGSLIASNDNWKINDQTGQSQEAAITATGLAPFDDRECVLTAELAPSQFTVVVRGKNNTTGVATVEVYDVNAPAGSRLANISTRGLVGSNADVIIGGFVIGSGNGAARVLIRALGPSLANYGIVHVLNDPQISLRNSNGTEIDADDDWSLYVNGDDYRFKEIQATGLAPTNDRESVVITTLANGSYTAIVSGYGGSTGVGLVEVYNLR
jgi:sugar lactone lactonase YvrE